MSKISKKWAILQFKPNAHKLAERNLNQQGFETFLPFEEVTKYKNKQLISTQRPLFPGYMFVAFERENTSWYKINNTYGVSRLVTFNSTLKSVPATFVTNLMKRCDLSGNLLPIEKLKKGDQVKLIKGPFANLAATVEKYEDDQRIWVLMDLMGRVTKIHTSSDALQPSD